MRRHGHVSAALQVSLNEPIRYSKNDQVEAWLHELLCLDVTSIPYTLKSCPNPNDCDLFCVDRDALFSYHKVPLMWCADMIPV